VNKIRYETCYRDQPFCCKPYRLQAGQCVATGKYSVWNFVPYSFSQKPVKLWSCETLPAIWVYSVTCHPTQVNALNLNQARLQDLYSHTRKNGGLSWPGWLVYDGLPVHKFKSHPSKGPALSNYIDRDHLKRYPNYSFRKSPTTYYLLFDFCSVAVETTASWRHGVMTLLKTKSRQKTGSCCFPRDSSKFLTKNMAA